MSMLIFHVGKNSFAIDCQSIERIIPSVDLKKISSFPNFLAGFLNLRRKTVPIIDFCHLMENRPAHSLLSTRIIIVKNTGSNSEQMLGIMGEHVMNFLYAKLEDFQPIDVYLKSYSFISRIFSENGEIIQYLDLREFFSFMNKELFHQKESHGSKESGA